MNPPWTFAARKIIEQNAFALHTRTPRGNASL